MSKVTVKRYLLFYGWSDVLTGGWRDFDGAYDDLEVAIQTGKQATSDNAPLRWYHVVDLETLKIVAES